MLIYDVLHKETIYQSIANDLRSIGVKYRFKKSAFKTERPEGIKNRKVFKTVLSYQALDVVNLVSGGIVHVPVFVSQATSFLENYLTQEGLFRKAGSQARQKELIARIDNGGTLGDKHHAIDVANCLKTFFRDLPEPLIPYSYHDLFVHCAMLKSCRVQALLLACILLPPHHLNTLAYLMEFLKKVSLYEKQNKMSIDNLAKVVGPNIMPLQHATMAAVQTRLELHLVIVKVLIENAESIGMLPDHITQNISLDTIGSTDNDLDTSDCQSNSKFRKKKHRSGSLTRKPHLSASNLNLRMFNGLRKIVGKGSPEVNNGLDNQQPPVNCDSLQGANTKSSKKRKVGERVDAPNTKKKRTTDKGEKPKKLRLSLDRFVPKTKQKSSDEDPELCRNTSDRYTERRWSSASNSYDSQKKSKVSNGLPSRRQLILKNNDTSNAELQQEYNNLFIDADVNLSDDSDEQVLLKKGDQASFCRSYAKLNSSSEDIKSSDDSDHTRSYTSQRRLILTNSDTYSAHLDPKSVAGESICNGESSEEYVKIPKSEYEEIKNRVSAIESRISQEFGRAQSEDDTLLIHSVNKVQTEYEKTLEEARIDNSLTTDYLAKKLGKELKIRRSGEAKIIRSPSARKIGSLRRRSQEKVMSRRVRRTSSWHISRGLEGQLQVQPESDFADIYSVTKSSVTLSSNYTQSAIFPRVSGFNWDEGTNGGLSNLCNNLNKQDSRTSKRLKAAEKNKYAACESLHSVHNPGHTSVRRVSSFHGSEFANTVSFNKKVERLKKSNSQQSILPINSRSVHSDVKQPDGWKESIASWSDAAGYFKPSTQISTPVIQTGRASIAKLRTQNAGMVLAKAKLFDECTTKICATNTTSNKSRDGHPISIQRHKDIPKEKNLQGFKVCEINVEKSDDICMEPQKENVVVKTPPVKKIPVNTIANDSRLSVYKTDSNSICKTPHIKKPLTVKTPKSAKLARRPAVEMRRTPLRAVAQLASPKYQSPKSILKSRNIARHI